MQRSRGAVLFLAVLAAGCGGGGERQAAGGPLSVFAASSLTEVFSKLDPSARFNFAGSDDLALQIREGAPADVCAAASAKLPDQLHEEGLVEQPRVFATNRLVLIVPRANPAGIASVFDLAKPNVKLVIGAAGVPVGDYTRIVISRLEVEKILGNVVSNEDNVKGVASKVALGEADAGFVYATDATPLGDKVRVIEIPPDAQPPIRYEIAVVSASKRREAAQAFVDRVLGPDGRAALEQAGFGLP